MGDGELELTGRLLQASNATFQAELTTATSRLTCVYKPSRGERPLWDFPDHTLGLREVAAYRVSRAGGFDLVPVTVLADGPFGPGSLQVWVDVDLDTTVVDLVPADRAPEPGWFGVLEGLDAEEQSVVLRHADDPRLRRMAVFDVLINNADRKGGHILPSAGRLFGVDHGVSFHTEDKLRTLLWGWAGTPLTEAELTGVRRVRDDGPAACAGLLAEGEIGALLARVETLLARGTLPEPDDAWPAIPWPPF
ncbi:MAG: SCO1664 family protein [Propionibacteriaceae bacterium]